MIYIFTFRLVNLNWARSSFSNSHNQKMHNVLPRLLHTVISLSLHFGCLHTGFPLRSIRSS